MPVDRPPSGMTGEGRSASHGAVQASLRRAPIGSASSCAACLPASLPRLLLLVLAPAALAYNDGRGFYGATNDKVITNAGFILIIFFPTFVLVMSFMQWRLDKRKQARKAAQKARIGDARWRGGW